MLRTPRERSSRIAAAAGCGAVLGVVTVLAVGGGTGGIFMVITVAVLGSVVLAHWAELRVELVRALAAAPDDQVPAGWRPTVRAVRDGLVEARGEAGSPGAGGEAAHDTVRVRSGSPYERAYGFCRARRVGDRIEVAGTAPVPPPGGSVAATAGDQLLRCGEIAGKAIADLGGSAADVVRTRMYLTDPADADEVGRAHAQLFGEAEPVATMVVVAALLDPTWKVELEVVAHLSR